MYRFHLLILLLLSVVIVDAQREQDSIVSKYQKSNLVPQEVVHLHLNKAAFTIGEDLAFTAYVTDRKNKKSSLLTKNLYCQLTDPNGAIVKSKLLQVNNGSVTNVFKLDSTMRTGSYRLRAFTNFMRNFEKPHYFETTFKINDQNNKSSQTDQEIITQLDVQFLPESGHLLSSVNNVVGIIARSKNQAIKITDGVILEDGIPLREFTTSELGIGRINLVPKPNSVYAATYFWNGNEFKATIPQTENIGVVLSINVAKDKVFAVLRSNNRTVEVVKDRDFHMAIHNGENIQVLPVKIEKNETTLAVPLNSLGYGVNVFTLFDNDQQPIAERSYFNYNKLPILNVESTVMKVVYDSVLVDMKLQSQFKDIDPINNFSVSIVPVTSIAINDNNNLLANTLLKPFIQGHLENPSYYFKNITRKTKFDMDNLMLTQGWSGYDWSRLFNKKPQFQYPFELGISMNVLTKRKKDNRFMIYPLQQSNTQILEIENTEEKYFVNNLFPLEEEKILMSVMSEQGQFSKPSVVVGFTPSSVPKLNKSISYKDFEIPDVYINQDKKLFDRSAQELNEIVLVANRDEERKDSIVSRAYGNVDYFTDATREKGTDMVSYFARRGYRTSIVKGVLNIESSSPNRGNPVFVIDNQIYREANILYNFQMNVIDYIEIDKSGVIDGRYFNGDIIKIKTNPLLLGKASGNPNILNIEVPLKFASMRNFYTPAYINYEDESFSKLGVIAWKGSLQALNNGDISFSIPYRGLENYRIIIEGIDVNGNIISQDINASLAR